MPDEFYIVHGALFKYRGTHNLPGGRMRAEHGVSFQTPLILQRFFTDNDVVAEYVTLPDGITRTHRNDGGNTLADIEGGNVRLHFWFDDTVTGRDLRLFTKELFRTLNSRQLRVSRLVA